MSFRWWIIALAVLALCAGLASAQIASSVAGAGPFACQANVAVVPTMRAEGLTELVGDLVLTCTGGVTPTLGSVLPTANFTVSFGTNVTSRLLGYNTTANPLTASNTSEALLLIDEPGSGLTVAPPGAVGFGPDAAQKLCGVGGVPSSLVGAGTGGCVQYVQQAPQGDFVMSSSPASAVPGANVFAGVVNGNQVTFYGIPILPPAVAGTARVFRMINIRLNANAFPAGVFPQFASISVSGSTSVPVDQPFQVVGFAQPGLTFQIRTPDNSGPLTIPNFSACVANTPCQYGMLRFSENFGTAFKTRVAPLSAAVGSGQARNLTGQNIPGQVYNSESSFIFSGITGTSNNAVAGLIDFGTRLKATFTNLPVGARLFVAATNIVNLVAPPAGNSTTSFARLLTSETAIDSDGSTPSVPTYGAAEIPVVNGAATAVWEVVNTNPAALENFDFPLSIVFPTGVTPAAINIGGNAAPNQDNGAFSMPAGALAQDGTYPVPRFTSAAPVPATFTISPNQASNTGNVTVIMNSNAYLPLLYFSAQPTLRSAGLPDIPGTIISTNYGTLPAAVTFNLAGAAPGVRDVVLLAGTWECTSAGCVWDPGAWVLASFPAAFTILAPPPCTFHLSASSAQYGVGLGFGQVVVSASSPSCTWSAVTDSPSWLGASWTPFFPILNYSVLANPGPGQRIGHIQVGGSSGPVLTVTQAGTATCTYSINPASQAFPSGGGSGSISVTAASGCGWSVTGIPGWANAVSGSPGSGNGSFNYTVPLNSGGPRTATLTVAGKTFALSQGGSACGPATDVTSQMKVTPGAFLGAPPLFQSFSQTVTLTNAGTTFIAGPIQYIMDGLPRRGSPCPANAACSVVNPAPTTTYCQSTAGSAMVLMYGGGLAPGQSVSKTFTFAPGAANGGSAAALQYTPRVLSGVPNQ